MLRSACRGFVKIVFLSLISMICPANIIAIVSDIYLATAKLCVINRYVMFFFTLIL